MVKKLHRLFAPAAEEEPPAPPPAPPPEKGTASFQILLDVPAQKPVLDFDRYADALSQIIQHSPPRFTIGLFGGWGSGKTTLMHAIEARLDIGRCIPVRFSAWRYEREEHLVIPLIDTIREAIRKYDYGGRAALKAVNTLGGVVQSLIAGVGFKVGVPGALELSLDSGKALAEARRIEGEDADKPGSLYFESFTSMRKAFKDFREAVAAQQTRSAESPAPEPRFVVFVDDLDRCLPEGALTVLEAMKLFFDYDGFVFVVGLDREVVEAAITARYRDGGDSVHLDPQAEAGTQAQGRAGPRDHLRAARLARRQGGTTRLPQRLHRAAAPPGAPRRRGPRDRAGGPSSRPRRRASQLHRLRLAAAAGLGAAPGSSDRSLHLCR